MPLTIGIAGAGLMGRILAVQLAQAGHSVTMFDRDSKREGDAAGFTAAGMLTPYAEIESAEPVIFQLGMRSLKLWPGFLASLSAPVRYRTRGSLVLAHGADLPDLRQFKQQVLNKLAPSSEQFVELTHSGIAQLEPELASHFRQGVYLPEESWVSAVDFMDVAALQAEQLGVRWREHTPASKVMPNCIETEVGQHTFDLTIDTRGRGAKTQWSAIRGVRGELMWLQAPAVTLSRLVRLMHPRYRLYVVPTGKDDIYIVGATQIESDDSSPISVRSALELLSAVYSIHPGFAEARIIKTATNCRPALVDNLPCIETQAGLVRVNGLFRHGYLLAPALAEQVQCWINTGDDNRCHNYLSKHYDLAASH